MTEKELAEKLRVEFGRRLKSFLGQATVNAALFVEVQAVVNEALDALVAEAPPGLLSERPCVKVVSGDTPDRILLRPANAAAWRLFEIAHGVARLDGGPYANQRRPVPPEGASFVLIPMQVEGKYARYDFDNAKHLYVFAGIEDESQFELAEPVEDDDG